MEPAILNIDEGNKQYTLRGDVQQLYVLCIVCVLHACNLLANLYTRLIWVKSARGNH